MEVMYVDSRTGRLVLGLPLLKNGFVISLRIEWHNFVIVKESKHALNGSHPMLKWLKVVINHYLSYLQATDTSVHLSNNDAQQFLIPLLTFGPNNQIQQLKWVLMLAKMLKRWVNCKFQAAPRYCTRWGTCKKEIHLTLLSCSWDWSCSLVSSIMQAYSTYICEIMICGTCDGIK